MMELYYMGGSLFMGILTIIFISMLGVSLINGISIFKGADFSPEEISRKLNYTKSVGLFALIVGLLGQLIGLFSAFQAIEIGQVNISPEMLAGGFKVSMITTLYGILIYVLSFIIWFGMSAFLTKK